jgi:hypothetical protein
MKITRIVCSILILAFFITAAYAAEAAFSASSLTAKDVNCRKCHTATPHLIHAQKPVECVNCHGDKSSVSIPQCTKCHDGLIHQVHAGKVSTQSCDYCHKNIGNVHNALMKDAVCSHCHQDLIVVHGKENACTKCHKSPPDIVKPVKSESMVLICQDCHAKPSVATIHGAVDDKKGCYECHKGTSTAVGNEIPHVIHAGKIDCQGCHQENGKVVVPQCTRCHDIDKLHAFNKIGKLTSQSGLRCTACHQAEAKVSVTQTSPPKPAETASPVKTVSTPAGTIAAAGTPEAVKTPGFTATFATGIFAALYLSGRRRKGHSF